MSDSFDSLKDFPRVPRTDASGIQIGVGGIPPHKKTANYGRPVSMEEAAANMVRRKNGELPLIPGGIDDNDPALYDPPKTSSPFEKMHVAQHGSLTPEQVEMLKRKNTEEPPVESGGPVKEEPDVPPVQDPEPPQEVQRREIPPIQYAPLKVDTVDGQVVLYPDQSVPTPAFAESAAPKRRRRTAQPQPQVQVIEKPVYVTKEVPVFKEVEKVVEKEVVKPGPFEEWSKRRVRVQIGTQETTFNISAIAAVKSIAGVTIFLPTANDAMTFIPRTGAKVTLGIKDDVIDTIFTGVSFDIEELGVMGLCFLVRKKEPTAT